MSLHFERYGACRKYIATPFRAKPYEQMLSTMKSSTNEKHVQNVVSGI